MYRSHRLDSHRSPHSRDCLCCCLRSPPCPHLHGSFFLQTPAASLPSSFASVLPPVACLPASSAAVALDTAHPGAHTLLPLSIPPAVPPPFPLTAPCTPLPHPPPRPHGLSGNAPAG